MSTKKSKQEYAVSLQEVTFERDGRKIFKKINLKIPAKKIVAILGPSGTGKTTLLHLIGGLIKPLDGDINVLDKKLTKLSTRKKYELRRRIGMLFQSGASFTDLSVFDNIAFPLRQNKNIPEWMINDRLQQWKIENERGIFNGGFTFFNSWKC